MHNDEFLRFDPSAASGTATLKVDVSRRGETPVSPLLFGKFCEHLGHNIYQGMDAEILFNPTFGKWVFSGPTDRADGGMHAEYDPVRIAQLAAARARRLGVPDGQLATGGPSLADEYLDGLAYGWFRLGSRETVRVSPDVGPHGDRAQRVEILSAADGPQGLAQWIYLPLHRTRGFVFRMVARATTPMDVELALAPVTPSGRAGGAVAAATMSVGPEWTTLEGRLDIAPGGALDPEGLNRLAITAGIKGNLVLDRIVLYPDDHIEHFDPDIIRMLKESRLPLLRWPGGNFVSGYRWRPGVGPVDARPTLRNPAWESLEYNLFGTDEFLAYCRLVGCEPMICLNAGDGTPQEAAEWVEYCNGSIETPMGLLRAENGHPEPYGVRLWEIGNELDGRHQVGWTTAGGYADRYRQFVRAMRAVDPTLRILACGSHVQILTEWNTALIDDCAADVNTITHHVLNGGTVGERADRLQLFHSFMGYARPLSQMYDALLDQMRAGGIRNPRVAITEMQLFAHFQGTPGIGGALSPATMPGNQTISEALYVATVLHECIRMGESMELVTHSATVNHGGGLRKTHERVWGNPIHYGHVMLRELADGHPVALDLRCDTYSTRQSFGDGIMPPLDQVPAIDALAVLSAGGSQLIVSLVHRSAISGPITLEIDLDDLPVGERAKVTMLSGDAWWDQNTEKEPERIVPRASEVAVSGSRLIVTLPPYTYAQVAFAVGGR
ncbi:MAG: alpha-L-arabinofuranosidase C-terminal domain-containing protein [Anaerolineae bacterium]